MSVQIILYHLPSSYTLHCMDSIDCAETSTTHTIHWYLTRSVVSGLAKSLAEYLFADLVDVPLNEQ